MAQQTFSGVPGDFTAGQVLTAADMDKLREFLLYLIKDGDETDTGEVSPLILDLNDDRVGINTDAPNNSVSVGIATASPVPNVLKGLDIQYGTETKGGVQVNPSTGEVRIGALNSTGDYFVTLYADNAERLRILAAGGLTFNGDTAAANALDDYEEGTWTPGIKFSTTAATVSVTHATYTKIGRMVHCMITALRPTNFNGGTGNISLTGLPFTSGASYYYGTVQGSPLSMAAGESFIQVYVEAGTTCRLLVQSTTAHADITDGDCATTTTFYGSFTYFV